MQVLTGCMVLGQDSARDLADASLEELMNVEVYTASKHLQSTRAAPAFITIVSTDDIRNHGYRTLAEILRSVPGMYITDDHNYYNIGIRGYMRPDDNNTFLLLIDGHRLNDAIFENASIGRDLPLDVDLIERVEVIRGPGSSLYGTNAFFGVINIITRRGRDLGLETSVEGASFGSGKGRFTYGHAFPRWKVLFSGSFYGSAGQTLMGNDPFGAELNRIIVGKTVDGRALEVVRVNRAEPAQHCHVLFIGSFPVGVLRETMAQMRGEAVLTVGDSAEFMQQGGLIRFLLMDNHIRFEINLEAAEQARLKISSKLLALAQNVRGRLGGGG